MSSSVHPFQAVAFLPTGLGVGAVGKGAPLEVTVVSACMLREPEALWPIARREVGKKYSLALCGRKGESKTQRKILHPALPSQVPGPVLHSQVGTYVLEGRGTKDQA